MSMGVTARPGPRTGSVVLHGRATKTEGLEYDQIVLGALGDVARAVLLGPRPGRRDGHHAPSLT